MVKILSNKTAYLNKVPNSVKLSKNPLDKIDLKLLEGIQEGIPLFIEKDKLISLNDIEFITRNLETLNFFRGCKVGCTHCLKDAKNPKKGFESVLFEDLERFTNGFKLLSERFGFNLLNCTKYLTIIDDANPSDMPIKGLNNHHSVAEGMRLIFEKLAIPTLYVTSGWNKNSKQAQSGALEVNDMILKNKDSAKVEISINPFNRLMEKSREALKNKDRETADFFRNIYISNMVNTISTFLNLFEIDKASIIYRHAGDYEGNELVGEKETAKLYNEIYNSLSKNIGSKVEQLKCLAPEIITRFDKSHLIEPSGRARQYFPFDINMKVQDGLIKESLNWADKSEEEKYSELKYQALKCVDINGKIYTTKPATHTYCINSPIELTIPTNLQLNYIQKDLKTPNIFSDIDVY